LKLVVEDTETQPATALQKMRHHFNSGVRFFIGPQSSGEVSECLPFANANQIVFVSQSSTSPALAIADDGLFRFCNSDDVQGTVAANIAKATGLKHLIFSWRG
jgi:branched-chain amino acid transport system substrate-binding protein